MNKAVVAAITGAINAYMEQEVQAKAMPVRVPYSETSPWRLFGRQELMRARALWRTRRLNR
jgi:hypothetical protein